MAAFKSDVGSEGLPDMDEQIYERGDTIAIVHSVGAQNIEAWVRAVRGYAKLEAIDWHYVGGRARVAALGTKEEVERAREACRILLPALNEQLRQMYPKISGPDSAAGQIYEVVP